MSFLLAPAYYHILYLFTFVGLHFCICRKNTVHMAALTFFPYQCHHHHHEQYLHEYLMMMINIINILIIIRISTIIAMYLDAMLRVTRRTLMRMQQCIFELLLMHNCRQHHRQHQHHHLHLMICRHMVLRIKAPL